MRAAAFGRATRQALLCLLVCFATVADAQFLLRTVRATPAPPANPAAILDFTGWEIAIPTSRALTTGAGSPYAGGQLKYSNATAADIAQSEAAILNPIGTYSSEWLQVQQAPDAQYEVLFKSPIWGSPSSPFEASDHTRSELRQLTDGPTNSGDGKGDFKIADRGRITMVARPLRFPDLASNGTASTTGNNLTMMQIHPNDGLAGDNASSTVFSILALRKNGELQATLTNADGTRASDPPWNVPIVLLAGVQLGDVLWIELTTEADRLEWRAENRTRAAGTIVTLTQSVPDVASNGLTQRTRFQYFKAGCYHATPPNFSSDAPEAVSGVLAPLLVSDFAAVAIRSLSYTFLGP